MNNSPLPYTGKADEVFEVDLPAPEDDVPPKGAYEARIIDIEKKPSSKGNPMWILTWAIMTKGDWQGKEVRQWLTIIPTTMWKVTPVLAALGLGEAGAQSKFTKKDIINRMAIIVTDPEASNDARFTSIIDVQPHPKGAGTKASSKNAPF